MDNTILRKVQLAQLEITKEIRRVCEEYCIDYFLDSGTLIGAVRHKGFIPWDDDMDIGMLRDDYEKFIKIAPRALKEDYFLQTWDNDDNYPLAFAKVRKKNTEYVEAVAEKSGASNELYVDVFPYDVYSENENESINVIKKVNFYKTILMMQCNYKPWARHNSTTIKILVWLKYLPYNLYGKFISRENVKEKCTRYINKFSEEKSPTWLYEQGGAQCGKYKIPFECLSKLGTIEFEGEIFKCPSNSDKVLTIMYGDYMQLPPIEERENRHNIIKVKL